MKCGRSRGQEAEETRKDFNIVLIHQDKKFFFSELFKVIQDAISLIIQYRTMLIPSDFFEYILTSWTCNQFTLHHEFRIELGGQNLSKERQTVFFTVVTFTAVNTMNKEHRDPYMLTGPNHVLHGTIRKSGRNIKNTVHWVDNKLAQKKGLKFYQTPSNAIILYNTLPAYCIPKAIMMETGEIMYDKPNASPGPLPKISIKRQLQERIGFRNCWRKGRLPTKPQLNQKKQNPINKHGETCEEWATIPVLVERLDEDKDADENVDADLIIKERLVSGQSIDLFTQLEEVDIDFRVSGLPHAVLKQAENFRVREVVKKIESRPHRQDLRANCSKITSTTHSVTIRKRWFVKWAMSSYSNYSRQFPKCNAQNAFFIWNKEWSIAPVDISWLKANPANTFTNGDWMFSQSRTTSSRRRDTTCSARQNWGSERAVRGPQRSAEMYQNEFWRNSRSFPTRNPAYRDSKLKIGWTEEKSIAVDKLAQ